MAAQTNSSDLDVGPAALRLRYFRFAEYVLVYTGISAIGWFALFAVLLGAGDETRSSLGDGFSIGALLLGLVAAIAVAGFGVLAYRSGGRLRAGTVKRYSRLLPLIGLILLATAILFFVQGSGAMDKARRIELTSGLIAVQGYDLWTGTYTRTPEMEAQFAQAQAEADQLRSGAMPFLLQGDVGFLAGIVCLVGLWGLLRFRRARVDPSEGAMSMLEAIDRARHAQARPSVAGKPVSRARGTLFLLAAIAVLLVPYFVGVGDFGSVGSLAKGSAVGILVSIAAFFALFRAKQYFQISADSLLGSDKRAPILFLRSFSDDPKVNASAGISHEGLAQLLDLSVETRLANHFMDFGPFIAIGSPKEKIPQIGAARMRLLDDEWQRTVTAWMESSSAIVMYAGTTHWVGWELRRIIEGGWTTKLILLFPPVLPFPGFRQRKWLAKQTPDILARFDNAKAAFAGTAWEAAWAAIADPQSVLCLRFQPGGEIEVTRGARRSKDAYELSAAIAHLRLLDRRTAATAASS